MISDIYYDKPWGASSGCCCGYKEWKLVWEGDQISRKSESMNSYIVYWVSNSLPQLAQNMESSDMVAPQFWHFFEMVVVDSKPLPHLEQNSSSKGLFIPQYLQNGFSASARVLYCCREEGLSLCIIFFLFLFPCWTAPTIIRTRPIMISTPPNIIPPMMAAWKPPAFEHIWAISDVYVCTPPEILLQYSKLRLWIL